MTVCDRCGKRLDARTRDYDPLVAESCDDCFAIWREMVKDLARKWKTSFDSPTERKANGSEST